jgi:hypothetical protein
MTELEQPDLKDTRGRLRRLVLALTIGAIVAAATYAITYAMARPDKYAGEPVVWYSTPAAFVSYTTGFVGGGAFAITLALTTYLAKRKWRRERDVPKATAKTS